jgi:two-component system, sensor histidine kinase PdtaS
MTGTRTTLDDVMRENEELRSSLSEAEDTLEAIRSGLVDALVVETPEGKRVFTLQGADHSYRLFVEEMQQGAVTLSIAGTILFCNKRFAEIVQCGDRSLLGTPFQDLVASASRPAFDALLAQSTRERATGEVNLATAGGMVIPGFLAVKAFETDDSPGFCVVVSDLAEHRHHERIVAAETRLRAALKEKELLLKEAHHRVKKNLQVITSMLNLQASALEDETVRAPLLESRDRVRAIASIHEALYGSYDLTRVPFGSYAVELTTSLHRGFAEGGCSALLDVDVDEVELDIDTAIPLALILNELVTNAFKHGFPASREGLVKVGFHELADGRIELSVANNGVGFPAGIDLEAARSIGFRLVSMLAQQVGGIMRLGRDGGICFTLTLGGTT